MCSTIHTFARFALKTLTLTRRRTSANVHKYDLYNFINRLNPTTDMPAFCTCSVISYGRLFIIINCVLFRHLIIIIIITHCVVGRVARARRLDDDGAFLGREPVPSTVFRDDTIILCDRPDAAARSRAGDTRNNKWPYHTTIRCPVTIGRVAVDGNKKK